MLLLRYPLQLERYTEMLDISIAPLKVKGQKKVFHAMEREKKAGGAILISNE